MIDYPCLLYWTGELGRRGREIDPLLLSRLPIVEFSFNYVKWGDDEFWSNNLPKNMQNRMLTSILKFRPSSDGHFGSDMSSDRSKVLTLCFLTSQMGPMPVTGSQMNYDRCKKETLLKQSKLLEWSGMGRLPYKFAEQLWRLNSLKVMNY